MALMRFESTPEFQFGDLRPGDYFSEVGRFFHLRQVVIEGVYRKSVPVGRIAMAKDRVAIHDYPEEEMKPKNHGSSQTVYKITLLA